MVGDSGLSQAHGQRRGGGASGRGAADSARPAEAVPRPAGHLLAPGHGVTGLRTQRGWRSGTYDRDLAPESPLGAAPSRNREVRTPAR